MGAQQDLTQTYASNVLAAAFTGSLGGGTGFGLGGSGATTITVQNYFATSPTDPHLFSKSLEFELKALVA